MPEMMRRGYAINDLYALQNLMESVNEFEPITDRLPRITCPTLILNGEYDFFTPRKCHEVLRKGIKRSRLVIVQHAYHAYTLEHPAVTMRLIGAFLDHVRGRTRGRATSRSGSLPTTPRRRSLGFPAPGDHLRAIPLPAAAGRPTHASPQASAARRAPRARKDRRCILSNTTASAPRIAEPGA